MRRLLGPIIASCLAASATCAEDAAPAPLTTQPARILHTSQQPESVCFSPDGGSIAAACPDGNLHIWNLNDETSTTLHVASVRQAFFLPDSKTLATASTRLEIWDLESGKCIRECEPRPGTNETLFLRGIRADGKLLDAGAGLWDAQTGHLVFHCMSFCNLPWYGSSATPDGSMIAGGYRRGEGDAPSELVLFQRDLKQPIWQGGMNNTSFWSFTPDGQFLAYQLGDELIFRELCTMQIARSVRLDDMEGKGGFTISPDGALIAVAQRDGVALFDWRRRHRIATLRGAPPLAMDIAFGPDGRLLATVLNNDVLIYDLSSFTRRAALELQSPVDSLDDPDPVAAIDAIEQIAMHKDQDIPSIIAHFKHILNEPCTQPIDQLGDPDFQKRESALLLLQSRGFIAEPALRRAATAENFPETLARIQQLLDLVERRKTNLLAEEKWLIRGVQSLERIGSPKAVEALRYLEAAAPGCHIATLAAAARLRLVARGTVAR